MAGGARIRNAEPLPEKAKGLTPNRYLLVEPVNPGTAEGELKFADVEALADVISAFGMPKLTFELEEPDGDDVRKFEATKTYGAGDPAYVMEDFDLACLVAGMTANRPGSDESEIEKRPLLNQKLTLAAMDNLLAQLNKDKLSRLLSDISGRDALISAIDEELIRVEGLIKQAEVELAQNHGG